MKIEVNIKKKLGNFNLDINFSSDNLRTGILGRSGCGKSVTLKAIAGIITPDSGRIVINNKVLYDSDKNINLKPQERKVGYLFQNYALFPTMTVEKNISVVIKNKENKTIFVMLSALYAVKFREECIDIVDKVEDEQEKIELVDQYLKTFTWRSSYIAYDYFWKIVNKYKISLEKIWKVFIENAIKENSELNVMGLTKILQTYELNCRDLVWTIKINELTDKDRIVSVIYFIEEGNAFEGLSNKKAFFLLILFGWFLSSSNRTLRDHVSKAMIEILKDRFFLCKYVLEEFKDVNDPYIVQRLYGIVFGAVM